MSRGSSLLDAASLVRGPGGRAALFLQALAQLAAEGVHVATQSRKEPAKLACELRRPLGPQDEDGQGQQEEELYGANVEEFHAQPAVSLA